MAISTITEHETRVVSCPNPCCDQFQVTALQYATRMALEAVDREAADVRVLAFMPVTCVCGRAMSR